MQRHEPRCAGGEHFIDVLNPATGERLDRVPAAGEAELELALQSAREGILRTLCEMMQEKSYVLKQVF